MGHRRGDQRCPAYNERCAKCDALHHFAQHCGNRRMVSTVEVLTVGAEGVPPLTLTAQVDGREVEFVVDTGSPVSLLPRHLVHGNLRAPELSLRAYDDHLLNVLGVASVNVSWGGRGMEGSVYVVPEGRALMGRDLISECMYRG